MQEPKRWSHWVARAAHGARPFVVEHYAALAWNILRKLFPNAGAAVLMPNHFHLALPPEEHDVPEKLGGVLGAVSEAVLRENPESNFCWQPLPMFSVIADEKHLLRTLKYISLNPCRDKINGDPLLWRWSTYRDVHGATAERWQGPIQAWQRCLKTGLTVRIHDYVSTDSDVDVGGKIPPKRPAKRNDRVPFYDVYSIAQATAVALHIPLRELKESARARRYFCWLARMTGWRLPEPLAMICGMTKRNVRWHWKQTPPTETEINAGLVILGEPRFRAGVEFPQE